MGKLRNSENVWVLGAFLGITGLLAALILSLVSRWTAAPIARAEMHHRMEMLRQLNLPDFDNDPAQEAVNEGGLRFMAARKEGRIVGYVAEGSVSGYGGQIAGLVSFSPDGRILAVQILKHKETPGLGAAVCDRKFQKTLFNFWKAQPSGLPPNRVLDQFNGKSAAEAAQAKLSKDGGALEFRTGATVTSRAVTALVNQASAAFPAAKARFNERMAAP